MSRLETSTDMAVEFHTGEDSGGQVALVTVGSSDTTHRLQMESLISTPPQVNFYG